MTKNQMEKKTKNIVPKNEEITFYSSIGSTMKLVEDDNVTRKLKDVEMCRNI